MRGAAASLLNANAFDSRSHAPTVAGADRDRDRDRDWDTDADTGTARDRHTARMRLTERWGGLGLRPQRPLPAVWSGYGGSNLESRGKGRSMPSEYQRQVPVPTTRSVGTDPDGREDRKSTRLNSSHLGISYAVFC